MPFFRNKLAEESYDTTKDKLQIILTYFDDIRGPIVYLASPPEVKSEIDKLVCSLLDLNLPEGFFEHRIVKKDFSLVNYFFVISSSWSRGNTESIMLTVVLKSHQKISSIKKYIY